jgi:hypothetical protein
MHNVAKVVLNDLVVFLKKAARIIIILLILAVAFFVSGILSYFFFDTLDLTGMSFLKYFHSISLFNFVGSIFTLGMLIIFGFLLSGLFVYIIILYILPAIFFKFPMLIINSIRSYTMSVKRRVSDETADKRTNS